MEQEKAQPMLTLDTLGHGAARELFQQELDRVLENVLDPNAEATSKRRIRLDVEIVPNAARDECSVVVRASSKIAAPMGAGSTIFVGRRMGRAVATTFDPKQQQLAFDAASKPRSLEAERAAATQATGS